jgi:hypothetical protein
MTSCKHILEQGIKGFVHLCLFFHQLGDNTSWDDVLTSRQYSDCERKGTTFLEEEDHIVGPSVPR